MANSQMSEVIQHLRRAVLLREGAGLTDGQLLADYLGRRDEAALAALVRRHGPMVWGVCRRVLRNWHDAEDAFQATFLVLVRKAASIAPSELLANWLYGVAHQTALKARATTAKRGARERQVTEMPEPAVTEQGLWHDLQPLLDQELSRLPDKYRVAIVLCDLEGKTRKEAARQVGVPDGTLAARLARGRGMLAKRLARHGLAVSGGSLAALLSQSAASASAPTAVVTSTIKAANLYAAGQAAAGMISVKVAALTEGVLKTMLLTKLKLSALVLLTVVLAGIGLANIPHGAIRGAQAVVKEERTVAERRADEPKNGQESGAANLQGVWKVARTVANGKEVDEDPENGAVRMYFRGDTVHEMEGELFREVHTFALDPKEAPATIDLTSDRHGTIKAVYRFKDEALTLCRPIAPSGERPTKFESEPGSNLILLVLKRDPKAPKLDLEKVKAQQKARADRRGAVESLQRIALAMYAYRNDKGSFPAAAIFDGKEKPLLSWRAALLPYLGEENLYNQFNLNEPWDSVHNKKLLAKVPQVYGDAGSETAYQVIVGPDTPFNGTKVAEIRDGVANTILVAVAARSVPWTKPVDLSYLAGEPLPKFGGIFKEGFHVAAADGRVIFVPTNFNEKALRAVITAAGGERESFGDLLRADAKDKK